MLVLLRLACAHSHSEKAGFAELQKIPSVD